MSNRILILGNGFIGQRLKEELNCSQSSRRIKTFQDALTVIKDYKPKVLINCIGYTGKNNVDDCEFAIDKTLSANTFVPLLLAEAALRNNVKLVHTSSGCIYHYNYPKQKPITEEHVPDYYNLYYSRTKIYTENVLYELAKRYNILIVRIRVPLDSKSHPRNILNKLIKYRKVIDVPNSITYIPDFIKATQHLIKINARGIFNVACKGGLRYPQLLDAYRKYHPEFTYKTIHLKQLHLDRTNLILSTKKLQKSGFKVRTVQSVVEECVKEYIKYS